MRIVPFRLFCKPSQSCHQNSDPGKYILHLRSQNTVKAPDDKTVELCNNMAFHNEDDNEKKSKYLKLIQSDDSSEAPNKESSFTHQKGSEDGTPCFEQIQSELLHSKELCEDSVCDQSDGKVTSTEDIHPKFQSLDEPTDDTCDKPIINSVHTNDCLAIIPENTSNKGGTEAEIFGDLADHVSADIANEKIDDDSSSHIYNEIIYDHFTKSLVHQHSTQHNGIPTTCAEKFEEQTIENSNDDTMGKIYGDTQNNEIDDQRLRANEEPESCNSQNRDHLAIAESQNNLNISKNEINKIVHPFESNIVAGTVSEEPQDDSSFNVYNEIIPHNLSDCSLVINCSYSEEDNEAIEGVDSESDCESLNSDLIYGSAPASPKVQNGNLVDPCTCSMIDLSEFEVELTNTQHFRSSNFSPDFVAIEIFGETESDRIAEDHEEEVQISCLQWMSAFIVYFFFILSLCATLVFISKMGSDPSNSYSVFFTIALLFFLLMGALINLCEISEVLCHCKCKP